MRNDLARDRGNNNIERVDILFNGVAKTFRFRDILGLRALSDGKVDDKIAIRWRQSLVFIHNFVELQGMRRMSMSHWKILK